MRTCFFVIDLSVHLSAEQTCTAPKERLLRLAKLLLVCVLAVVANRLIAIFIVDFLQFPLFADTIFTAATTFAAGLIPGLAVALFSWFAFGIENGYLHSFFPVAIAEVLLIWRLKPAAPALSLARSRIIHSQREKEHRTALFIGVLATLMLLYIICAVVISALGGLMDYWIYAVRGRERAFFLTIDAFRESFLLEDIHVLAANIFARIPVNLIDRFIVIFGGYAISRVLVLLLKSPSR